MHLRGITLFIIMFAPVIQICLLHYHHVNDGNNKIIFYIPLIIKFCYKILLFIIKIKGFVKYNFNYLDQLSYIHDTHMLLLSHLQKMSQAIV